MKAKEPAMPSNIAFEKYFGKPSMNSRCQCGYVPRGFSDAVRHIRRVHKERVLWKAKI